MCLCLSVSACVVSEPLGHFFGLAMNFLSRRFEVCCGGWNVGCVCGCVRDMCVNRVWRMCVRMCVEGACMCVENVCVDVCGWRCVWMDVWMCV